MRDTIAIGAPEPHRLERRLEGRHVLGVLLAFFGTIFAVNGYFLVRAISTHTGVVAVEPYRKGLAYNRRIAADEQQTALGWRDTITATPTGEITVNLVGRDGQAVRGVTVTGTIGRPSTSANDRALLLGERAPGEYSGAAGVLAPGTWIIAFDARATTSDAEPIYRARRRLWLKP